MDNMLSSGFDGTVNWYGICMGVDTGMAGRGGIWRMMGYPCARNTIKWRVVRRGGDGNGGAVG